MEPSPLPLSSHSTQLECRYCNPGTKSRRAVSLPVPTLTSCVLGPVIACPCLSFATISLTVRVTMTRPTVINTSVLGSTAVGIRRYVCIRITCVTVLLPIVLNVTTRSRLCVRTSHVRTVARAMGWLSSAQRLSLYLFTRNFDILMRVAHK